MGRRWNRWSLRTQLSLAVTAIMLVLLALFSSILYVAVRSFLIDQAAMQLRVQVRALVGARADGPTESDSPARLPTALPTEQQRAELQSVAAALTSNTTNVAVYLPDGSVLARSPERSAERRFGPPWRGAWNQDHSAPALPAPPEPKRWVFERVLRGSTDVNYTDASNFERQLAVLVPVFDGDKLIGVVQVATPSSPIDALLRWLLATLIGGTVLVGVTALMLSLWATRTIINPLRQLVGVAQQVGAGDLTARTHLQTRNEIGTLGSAFDQMVAQLQTTFAVQRRFIADAAHELRTPLTAVGGQLDLLMMGAVSDPAQQRRSLQRMNGELERMGRLVDDLLTLSRLDARPTLRHEPVDLATLALDVAQGVRSLAPDHDLVVNAPAPVLVSGDADRLRQVLLNVLDNARKYTPPHSHIRVTVARHAANAVVTIADTGVGIPAEDVPHIWDRFYRVDQARTRTSGGAGLGLAIVKGIVEAHGGTVALESAVGSGTTVTLCFPSAVRAVKQGQPPLLPDGPAAQGEGVPVSPEVE